MFPLTRSDLFFVPTLQLFIAIYFEKGEQIFLPTGHNGFQTSGQKIQ